MYSVENIVYLNYCTYGNGLPSGDMQCSHLATHTHTHTHPSASAGIVTLPLKMLISDEPCFIFLNK